MPRTPHDAARRHTLLLLVSLSLAAIAWIYAPVNHAGFVWDDWLDFHDTAWLRQGDAWMHYVLKDFNGWNNYFRPLGVLLFTAEVRMFASQPPPMHLVSLVLHLVDTLLVFAVARRFARQLNPGQQPGYAPLVAMTLYGLHPALVETVAWIGCQFELLLTLFILLGLWAAMAITSRWRRAIAVSACFFLAAGAKESAAVFPMLVALLDWTLLPREHGESVGSHLWRMLSTAWPTYLAVVLAGVAYLAIRHAALGTLLTPNVSVPLSLQAHVQEVSFLYLQNWRMLLWPFSGMSPVHPVDIKRFEDISIQSTAISVVALGLFAWQVWSVLKKPPGLATLMLGVTIALLPVLHIIATDFDRSLYHERYVTVALATACILLPILVPHLTRWRETSRVKLPIASLAAMGWLALSVLTIRTTLPLWANDTNLWRWARAMYPDSMEARDNLLGAYLRTDNRVAARALIDQLMTEKPMCVDCILNAAVFAVRENRPAAAERALERVRGSWELAVDRQMFGKYMLTTGQVLFMQGKADDAAKVLTQTMAVEPFDPEVALSLAIVEAGRGDCARSSQLAAQGIALLPPAERARRRKSVALEIASSSKPQQTCKLATATAP